MPTETDLHTATGTLSPRAPFDFAKTLAFMRQFSPMDGEQTIAGGALTKAQMVGGRAVACRLRATGSIEQPELAYMLYATRALDGSEREAALDRVRFFLSLGDDLAPFYATARVDPAFAPVMERFYGLHQPKFLTPFEIACWAVLAQRTPMPVARRLKDRLTERYGASVDVDGVTYRAFPDVAQLAAATSAELAEVLHHERKADYLAAVVRFFAETEEGWLRSAPYDAVAARLRGVRGIGEWSATFILVRGLGRMERVPVAEPALAQAAARLYNEGQPLTPDALRRMLDRYGATQGYWAFYTRIAVNGGDHRSLGA